MRTCIRIKGSRVRHHFYALLGVLFLASPSAGFAQGCSNDVPVVFRTGPSGSVELRDASVRDITGNNNDDRDVPTNISGPLNTTVVGGALTVDTMGADDFPDDAAALRAGFNRNVNRFWETNYPNDGDYDFANRGDLNLDITYTITNDQVAGTGGGNPSVATITATTNRLRTNWYGGSNSLRRLRGDVRLRITDLDTLTQASLHRAQITVCIEVTGQI